VTMGSHSIAVFNVGTTLFAIDAACTHVRGPLERGRVEGDIVTCPLHGSKFSVRTGEVLRGPAMQPVKIYPVRVENGKVAIELP
jgi:nitrite reductase/ring-hydroxylating ferredoxin subunit